MRVAKDGRLSLVIQSIVARPCRPCVYIGRCPLTGSLSERLHTLPLFHHRAELRGRRIVKVRKSVRGRMSFMVFIF